MLAAQGAQVVVNYAEREDAAKALVEQIREDGGTAEAERFDVTDTAAVEAAVAGVAKRLGRLDILVANAGVAIDGLLMRFKDADFEQTMAVNVRGALACARAAIKPMLRARTGRIVFVSSVIGETGNIGQVAYAASKAALLGLARSLAREVGSRGITVNAVSPGLVNTDMTARIDPATRDKIVQQVTLGRFGAPEDVAAAILYLCSEEAGYVTGQTIRVNGGMYM
jgi:3-oxoacyl-[acyl-carrier protein] reductase